MKISCSILCYNYGRFLKQAIDSCLLQDTADHELEVIVIDDGSTDATPEICRSYEDKIRYFRSGNEGFACSLTKAVKYAEGDVVCLLDADDYFLPGKLKAIIEKFEENEKLLFLYHDQSLLNEDERIVKDYQKGGNTSTQAFKRIAALDLLPAYNEQFFYTLYMAGHGYHLKKKLSIYRIHTHSMSKPERICIWKKELVKMNVLHLRKLKTLMQHIPDWADASVLKKIYAAIAASYNYLKMEIALNRNKTAAAFRFYLCILYWDAKGKKINFYNVKYIVTYFFLKRYVKY